MATKTNTPKLNSTEKKILRLAAEEGSATLDAMTSAFRAQAREQPKKWKYAADRPGDEIHWKANLLVRNGIRKPVRLGLIRKVKPGTYAITAAGRKAI